MKRYSDLAELCFSDLKIQLTVSRVSQMKCPFRLSSSQHGLLSCPRN